MKGIVLAVALGLSTGAQAQSVIVKCVDAKGQVMYVSGGCEPGQRVDSYKAYEAVHDDPNAAARTRSAQREVDARRAAYGHQAVGVAIPAERSPSACASAKAYRDSVLKAAGMSRTYDLLQQLDDGVRAACR